MNAVMNEIFSEIAVTPDTLGHDNINEKVINLQNYNSFFGASKLDVDNETWNRIIGTR